MTDRQRDDLMRATDEVVRVWFAIKDSDPKTAKEIDKIIDKLVKITS